MFEAQEVHYAHIGAVAITKRRCLLNKCLGLRSKLLTLPIECLCPLVLT